MDGAGLPAGREAWWGLAPDVALRLVRGAPDGLSSGEAARRLAAGARPLRPHEAGDLALLLRQLGSPIVLLLLAATALAYALGERLDAAIVLCIVLVSAGLGFVQERGAHRAMRSLLALVESRARVLRDGVEQVVPADAVVSGDVVLLSAGSTVPADGLLLEEHSLYVNEAMLTGETWPAEKTVGAVARDAPIARRTNALFLGTHVMSGTGRMLAIALGADTEFGKVAGRLRLRAPQNEFERGVRRFGALLVQVTLLLALAIFACNVFFQRPVLDSFLFSLALAVGLTPQLLPAIISVNLSHGARRMAARRVIVRKLSSIESLGNMDVLCSDKTGTLTEGVVRLHDALDVEGRPSDDVLRHAWLNARLETGFANPIDEALRTLDRFSLEGVEKIDEVPYDFVRKRLTVLVRQGDRRLLVTKGAVAQVLEACTRARGTDDADAPLADRAANVQRTVGTAASQGMRALGVAVREVGPATPASPAEERDMTFLGVVLFEDPPKADAPATVATLRARGVALKIVTGDDPRVGAHVARAVGVDEPRILTGPEIRRMSDEALRQRASHVDVFAAVEPNAKERIILALKKAGHVVGYMGDGINDASALHAADVGISVEGAADVAREAADLVLLEHDLGVLLGGLDEGRLTFANTMKYVYMATSANFGNMFSMAGASLLLPFLPLLPKQILLLNLLTDLPEMGVARDRVDPEAVATPQRWDVARLRRFMVGFGLLSSVFDFLTFGLLLLVLRASPETFRTGWFVESVVSACLVVIVLRTRRPFWRSPPGRAIAVGTACVVLCALALPHTPLASPLGLVPLPAGFLGALAGIVVLYGALAEWAKRRFGTA